MSGGGELSNAELKAMLAEAQLARKELEAKLAQKELEEDTIVLPSASERPDAYNPASKFVEEGYGKYCNACLEVVWHGKFSKSQLDKSAGTRRCEDCIESGKELSDAAKAKLEEVKERRRISKAKKLAAKQKKREEQKAKLEAAEQERREAAEASLKKQKLAELESSILEKIQADKKSQIEEWKIQQKSLRTAIQENEAKIALLFAESVSVDDAKLIALKEKDAELNGKLREVSLKLGDWM